MMESKPDLCVADHTLTSHDEFWFHTMRRFGRFVPVQSISTRPCVQSGLKPTVFDHCIVRKSVISTASRDELVQIAIPNIFTKSVVSWLLTDRNVI